MTHRFKLSRRIARFRAVALGTAALAFAACNADSLDPNASTPETVAQPAASAEVVTVNVAYSGGIPFGTSRLPTSEFGSRFNGALRNIYPNQLLGELKAIKAKGGKVALMFAGNEMTYKDAQGHFSLTKWQARINRFKGVNFTSFINDGTIIGHYMIDEPNDPVNWHGKPVSPAVLEQMGQYSKKLWPNMLTIVRVRPYYLSAKPKYIDAAWAQYAARFGDPAKYAADNVAQAKSRGIGLVIGMNISKGTLSKTRMPASMIKSVGSALLSNSYPCAFISWRYETDLTSSAAVKDALQSLRSKAQNRPAKSCRGG